ncbi:sensor domain-containing protein [Plantactinospora sp. S1510]|uniref:histidine kinase n=1 Tax=Plantactinospora alkalitolerans TaxID=2789879 RepID=A0ABS0H120_9ACTN|nr:sensor domain-containing protein [Plantactinospora alkalitolerans]MBF9131817.1 sensor domain-containing protein [Plantactinospora alkalitolerans]
MDSSPAQWLRQLRPWLRRRLVDGGQALLLAVLSTSANIVLLVLSLLALVFTVLGVGVFAFPAVTLAVRDLANLNRRLATRWSGEEIPVPYRPEPAGSGIWAHYRWVITDPATWRDLLWLLVSIPVGLVLGLLPLCLLAYGLEGLIGVPVLLWSLDIWYGYGATWPIDNVFEAVLAVPQGGLVLFLGGLLGQRVQHLHAGFIRALLAPTPRETLNQRVRRLTETRSDAMDAQAAELRRIERDLHDGAQARLVALSMNIGLAEALMDRDPETAQRLMAEAREASGEALGELRDLVRGIHPPVLAERGLDGAVRALALKLPLSIEVDVELPGRPQAPVESAAYFAVAELLANVAKHSHAEHAWVRLGHSEGRLVVVVADSGLGGADPAAGGGLQGIERRLAAFDGTMSVASPPGGPTTVTMELPCELSSPKTSPYFETG